MHNIPDFLRITPEMQEHFAKGGMIKRADGSYSRRGLWDNIRANKGSGRKPTKEMLEQERKIRAKEYEVGGSITFTAGGEKHRVYEKESPTGNGKGVQGHIMVNHPTTDKGQWDTIDFTEKAGAHTVAEGVAATKEWHAENPEYGKGGYTVKRSNARKGKTHVVIGPDGTKKYFGDSKLGQHPNDPARKKAFYARHKHNLAHNPYFRAFARATWEDGGEIPTYASGTSFVNLSEVKISPKEYKELSADELRALHNKVGKPESSDKRPRLARVIRDSIKNDIHSLKRLKDVIANTSGTNNMIIDPSTQYEGNNGQYYPLTPREAEQYNQYESNLPWYKNLWYNIATKDIPEGSRLANYEQRQGAYMNNLPYVYTDTNDDAAQLNAPVIYKGKTYTTPFIVNPQEEGLIYYPNGTVAPSNRPNTGNSTQINPEWIAEMQQQGFKHGGNYGPFYGRRDAAKLQRWRTPTADSMTPSFANGGLTKYQIKGFVDDPEGTSYMPQTANSGQGINTTTAPINPAVANINDDFQLPNIMGNEGYGQNMKVSTPVNRTLQYESMTNDGSAQKVIDDKAAISQNLPNLTIDQGNTSTPANTPGKTNPNEITLPELTVKPKSDTETPDDTKLNKYKRTGQMVRGAGLAGLGALGLTKELTNVNPNSEESAILDFTRQSLDNSRNRLAVREENRGIAYGKYGGKLVDKYKEYNEGDTIDNITPTERYALEKLGYKFQIL